MIRYVSDKDGVIVHLMQSHHTLHEQEHLPPEPASIAGFRHILKHDENGLFWHSERTPLTVEEQLELANQRVAVLEKMLSGSEAFNELPSTPPEELIPGDTPSTLPNELGDLEVPATSGVDTSDLPDVLSEDLLGDLEM